MCIAMELNTYAITQATFSSEQISPADSDLQTVGFGIITQSFEGVATFFRPVIACKEEHFCSRALFWQHFKDSCT